MPDGARGDVEQMLVHNLRAPLTGLLATLEMFEDGDFGSLGPAQSEAVKAMRSQGTELLALVDELLEIWRMEAPAIRPAPERIDLAGLIRQVETEWSSRLGGRLSVATTLPLPDVMGDEPVLRRVLGNLLLNAIVHGGDGVSVRISAAVEGTLAHIDVEDDGPGVPAADSARVFEKFVQGAAPVAGGRRPGSGLGLTYCRAAMEALGGHIALLPPGDASGATFRMSLPVANGPGAA